MRLFLTLLVLLFATMFWVNKKPIYKVVYAILNLILITIIFNFLVMFTSFIEISPWHESENIQILVPVYMAIWLLLIGGLLMMISIKIFVPNIIQYTPFAAGLILGAIVLYEQPEEIFIQIVGAIVSISLFITITSSFISNFEKTFFNNKKQSKKQNP